MYLKLLFSGKTYASSKNPASSAKIVGIRVLYMYKDASDYHYSKGFFLSGKS